MKYAYILIKSLFFASILFSAYGQKIPATTSDKKIDTTFSQLVNHFKLLNSYRKDNLSLPTLLATKSYNVILADSALHLHKQRRILTNPFSSAKYPLSYSVLYQDNLVSLFDPGYFVCFNSNDWHRNLSLEKQLNTKHFDRHWLIDGRLVGLSAGQCWQFRPEAGWQLYTKGVPFGERPKLFEDVNYLVYNECSGEFGGRIFFFDKQTKKIYWTKSTCAVWVRHTPQGYEVLSSLGHGMGSADKQLITKPRSLPEWTGKPIADAATMDSSYKPATQFTIHSVQLFGGLERQHQLLYLAHIADRTCLASLSDTTFTIVDPLFNNDLYTHQPVTTNYNGVTLINLDFYGIGRYREVSCLLLKNNQVTLLDWHEVHFR